MKKVLLGIITLFTILSLFACSDKKLDNDFYILSFFTFESDPNRIPSQRVEVGERPIEPQTPSRTAAVFQGWTDISGIPFDFSIPLTSSTFIIAVWEFRSLTISYDVAGGSVADFPTEFEFGEIIIFPTPIRQNYTFNGWFEIGSRNRIESTRNIGRDLVIEARWTIQTWSITFNTGIDGLSVRSTSFEFGSTISGLPVISAPGKTFLGWFTARTGGVQVQNGDLVQPTSSRATLYAQWD